MNRRQALRAGSGAAASTWLAGCSAGDGGDAKPPTPSLTAAAPTTPAGTASSATPGGPPDWPALAKGLAGALVRPDDSGYDASRRLYNTRFDDLLPAAIAYVSSADDIRECLAFARGSRSVRLSIRSGGHSYAGWSSGGQDHLVLDVSRLDAISATGTTATVGAGAKLIDLYSRLGDRGRTVPAGSCPSVGVSGLTLGGGHGVLSRSYGLTCDSLTGATIITADGKQLDCDATANSDLFWALRGAGCGNFGVVTELRFATHPAPSVVTGYATWPWSRAAAVVRAWQEWGPDQPDEIWSSLHLDAPAGGSPKVSVATLTTGSRSDLASAMDRLSGSAGGGAPSLSLRPRSYLEAMFSYAGCSDLSTAQCHLPPKGRLQRETYTARSDFYDHSLSPTGIQTLLTQVERLGSISGGGAGSVALTALGGAVNRVDPGATAFVHRRSRFLAQYIASDALSRTTWLDTLYEAMRRHASGSAYQNYTDPALKDWRQAYYGSAAARLTELKKKYDPDRLFDFPQAL
ncbi:FAD-binding oxidoreductase [Streptomyces sp. H10-C2]|uniref:FAD-binding oxidoreductase n=1 Tax=unclassified Streptomyces TaxID=2593676 RepID=UPI0024BA63E2|nr:MULTISPECIES: FAD-binding oxidoreductase [unclassified Streptomyces]MDJ0345113.1 FAD-binding oxidoreductase [Streptomyces sp. PH10-H1]MDJ0374018.1 FAD-binding oxidoreductase [Streptomyces sp. H10-C2]